MPVTRHRRRSPGRRPAALAAMLLLLAPAAVRAEAVRLDYAGFIGPTQVLRATVDLELRDGVPDGRYSMALDAGTVESFGQLLPLRFTASAHGATRSAEILPARYRSVTNLMQGEQAVTVTWRPGGVDVASQPPTREARLAQERQIGHGALDPLSAAVALVVGAARKGFCDGTIPVFDGMRRYDLLLEPAGRSPVLRQGPALYEGLASECLVRADLREGFHEADLRAGLYPESASLWLAAVLPGLPEMPVRVAGRSAVGDVRLDLVGARLLDAP